MSYFILPSGDASAAWQLHAASTIVAPVANLDILNIPTDAAEILVVIKNITLSLSTTRRMRFSDDNGVSFFTANADYQFLNNNGSETNSDGSLAFHGGSSVSARGGAISWEYVPGAEPIITRQNTTTSDNRMAFFAGSANPIDAVRILPNPSVGGNLLAGTVRVYFR